MRKLNARRPSTSCRWTSRSRSVKGNGERKLIVFSDADCPFCHRLENELKSRRQRHDLHVPVPDRPAPPGCRAQVEADLVLAATAGKAWDDFFASAARCPTTPATATTRSRRTQALGATLKINATPTLVFADGTIVPGALPAAQIEQEMTTARRRGEEARERRHASEVSSRGRAGGVRAPAQQRGGDPRRSPLHFGGTDGDPRFPQEAVHRHHRVDRRLARHAVVPLPRRGQGDQERRAADRARVAGRAVRVPRPVRRHVRSRQAHADDRQHPDPHRSQGLEVRRSRARSRPTSTTSSRGSSPATSGAPPTR